MIVFLCKHTFYYYKSAMKNPEKVVLQKQEATPKNIKHNFIRCHPKKKKQQLVSLIKKQ